MLPMSNGLELHLEHWGPTSGAPRVLMLHGITSSGATWWQIGEGLADRGWSVTAPDLRGHGKSPRADSYRHADLADDVLAVGVGWDLVVAHSLGGPVTILALNQDSTFARRAVLIDPALSFPSERMEAFLAATLDEVATADAHAYQAAHPSWHPRTVETRVEAHRAVDSGAIKGILTENRPWDVTEAAEAVAVPVHVIAADPLQGASFTAQDGQALQQVNPNWTWEIALGTSHSVHRDAPQLVLDRLVG
jgi:pimeloyl-ACP methyl ester carboxylesterase